MRRRPMITAVADSGTGTVTRSTVRMHLPLEFPVGVEILARNRSGPFHQRQAPFHPRLGLHLTGWVHMPELKMELMFGGEPGGSARPRWDVTTVIPPGSRLPVPAVALDGEHGERRDLWILTSEPSQEPPWLEHYAGHSDQRAITFGRQIVARAILDLSCCVDENRDQAAAQAEIWGDVVFEEPLAVRYTLRDAGRATTDESREMTVITSGTRVPMLRRSLSGPAGSEPWIVLRVSDKEARVMSAGREIGDRGRFG